MCGPPSCALRWTRTPFAPSPSRNGRFRVNEKRALTSRTSQWEDGSSKGPGSRSRTFAVRRKGCRAFRRNTLVDPHITANFREIQTIVVAEHEFYAFQYISFSDAGICGNFHCYTNSRPRSSGVRNRAGKRNRCSPGNRAGHANSRPDAEDEWC